MRLWQTKKTETAKAACRRQTSVSKMFESVRRLALKLRLATILLTIIVAYAAILKRSRSLILIAVSAMALVTISTAFGYAKTPPKRSKTEQQQIFIRSDIVDHSQLLSLDGQPAYVVSAAGTNSGILIKAIDDRGLGATAGMGAGDVLISLNERVVLTAREADGILSQTPPGIVRVCFVHDSGKGLELYKGQMRYSKENALTRVEEPTLRIRSGGDSSKVSSDLLAEIAQVEAQMIQVINNDRARYGSSPVTENATLTAFARSRSKDMATRGYFGHIDPDGIGPQEKARTAGIRAGVFENISFRKGYGTILGNARACEASMMAEPPNQANHRSNILASERQSVGVGIAVNRAGVLFMTEEFSNGDP